MNACSLLCWQQHPFIFACAWRGADALRYITSFVDLFDGIIKYLFASLASSGRLPGRKIERSNSQPCLSPADPQTLCHPAAEFTSARSPAGSQQTPNSAQHIDHPNSSFPTDARGREQNRRKEEQAQDIEKKVVKRKKVMEDHHDDCGDDLSSLNIPDVAMSCAFDTDDALSDEDHAECLLRRLGTQHKYSLLISQRLPKRSQGDLVQGPIQELLSPLSPPAQVAVAPAEDQIGHTTGKLANVSIRMTNLGCQLVRHVKTESPEVMPITPSKKERASGLP